MEEVKKLLSIQKELGKILLSRREAQKTAKEVIKEEAKSKLFAAYCAVSEDIKRILSNSFY